MAEFTDRAGRRWQIRITVGHLIELRDLWALATDPADAASGVAELADNVGKLATVLATLCDDQITREGLTPLEFAERLDFPAALVALQQAILDFFHEAGHPAGTLLRLASGLPEMIAPGQPSSDLPPS